MITFFNSWGQYTLLVSIEYGTGTRVDVKTDRGLTRVKVSEEKKHLGNNWIMKDSLN